MLTIYGRTNSINVQKVMWCIGELGIPHKRVDAGMEYGVNNTTEYLAKNPNGRVPLLEEDDGFTLWESHSITRYLAAKHGAGSLSPTDPKPRADAERWMDWLITTIDRSMAAVFWGLIRTPPEKRDMAAIEAGRKTLAEQLRIADARLADRPYLGGDHLTIGDIPLGCHIHRWFRLPIERPALPHLEAWFNRLSERPAYREHVMLPLR